jgi:glutamate synthase (NADPH/NADH) small chain
MMRRDFDAIVLCTGATAPRDLPIEGRNLGGVHFAMDYLTEATRSVLGKGPAAAKIHAKGLDVVVIGGGDTGTDCVGSAMRQGCRTLTQFEIMSKPPLERAEDNPWPEWPRLYKMDYGQEEAAAKFGRDPRAYLTTVKKFVSDAEGRVGAQRARSARARRGARHRTYATGATRAAGDGLHGSGHRLAD